MLFTGHLNLKMCQNYNLSLVSYVITTHFSLSYLLSWHHVLYELLRKDTPWKWGKEQSKAFKQCKTLFHCDSLLVHYDPSKELVIAGDASTKGVGCVFSHLIDRVERLIALYNVP